MRLLKRVSDDIFSLVTFDNDDDVPDYAILSHTWGCSDDEVSIKDITEGSGRSKEGFKKLKFCGDQAEQDRLSYFWVDTGCIDKSSSAELSKAIRSMFHWYRRATRCYVYLADVTAWNQDGQLLPREWITAFRNSRWFTRGWTLQELLAPRCVQFFSRDETWLGNRVTLLKEIHSITDIDQGVLQGDDLADIPIEKRLSWVELRQTTISEDKAYAMVGVCNVNMCLRYDEGRDEAMRRLLRNATGSISRPLELPSDLKTNVYSFVVIVPPRNNYEQSYKAPVK